MTITETTLPDSPEAMVPPLEPLIVRAFEAARERGKEDWRRMTIAVLKNRLLQFSHGQFQEQRYGAAGIRELFLRYPQLIRLDGDSVELINQADRDPSGAANAHRRVRPDLWRATMDTASGKRYAWDLGRQYAREAAEADALIIPTLSSTEMEAWRREFAALHSAAGQDLWRDDAAGSRVLPPSFRARWNNFIKGKVASRLQQWFSLKGLEVAVFVENLESQKKQDPVEQLRSVVAACVAVMTAEELSELRLPPMAIQRAISSGRLREP